MSKNLNRLLGITFLFLVLWIFRSFVGLKEISAGDAPFYFSEALKNFPNFPYLWSSYYDLGSYNSLLFFFPYFVLPLKLLSFLGLPWVLVERIAWYWPFLILSAFSSWHLSKTVLPVKSFRFLVSFVYLFNTYILMIVGGGQVSIFLSYALAPLVLSLFIQLIDSSNTAGGWRTRKAITAGLILAIQVSFEPRIVYLTLIAVGVYWTINFLILKKLTSLKNLALSFLIVFSLHFYWLLPSLVLRKASFPPALTASSWTEFLSFARFSDSFSLLHPHWPENIFGKTYFFRPEFLILPILAYLSLLFINYSIANYSPRWQASAMRLKRKVLFFAFAGILGAFLAKGTNPPFGEVYLWLFNNFPGMNLFRDPTKFYLLTALSYSVLIPFSASEIYQFLKDKFK